MRECPVCNNYTLDEINYEYEICKECFWEYDPVQVENPDYFGGANYLSLNEYRTLYKELKTKNPNFSCKNLEDKNLMLKLSKEYSKKDRNKH